MMFQLVFVLFVTTLSFQGVYSRPKHSNENGNFGYNYKVTHSPGVSNVHLNFGGNKRPHQKSYIPTGDSKYDPSSIHSEPNNYQTEDTVRSAGTSKNVVYDPVTEEGSLATYSSPYDSVNKQDDYGYGGQNYAQEPQDYPSHDQSVINDPTYLPQNYQNNVIVKDDPHYSQQSVIPSYPITDPSLTEKSYGNPVSQQLVDVPIVNNHLPQANPSYGQQEEIIVPEGIQGSNYAEQISQPEAISQYNVEIPIQTKNPEYVSHSVPILQQDQDVPFQSSDPNFSSHSSYPLPISQSAPEKTVQSIEQSYESEPSPVTQHAINSNIPILDSTANGYSSDSANLHLSDSDSTAPVGPKYILVPSGPAYTRDSFSSEIIHGPGKSSVKTVPSSPIYNTKLPEADTVDFSPVSHSIPLPLNIDTPVPITDSLNTHSSSLSDQIEEISPISHSTRLLIPGDAILSHPVQVNTAPIISDDRPILIQEEKSSEIAPLSHSTRLLIPISNISPKTTSDSLPVLNSGLPAHSTGFQPVEDFANYDSPVPENSPLSHSFRLNVPQIVPGVLPVISDVKSDAEAASSGLINPSISEEAKISPPSHSFRLDLPNVDSSVSLETSNVNLRESLGSDSIGNIENKNFQESPVSHSVRLVWPPTAPDDQYLAAPEVQYAELSSPNENFKSSDYPLLAVESKRIKG